MDLDISRLHTFCTGSYKVNYDDFPFLFLLFFLFLYYYSDRKRMSVIVRMPSGQLRLYCKGAVSVSGVGEGLG